MFFILKDEKFVMAADNAFLKKAGAESIYLLAELFRVGRFPLNEVDHICRINGKDEVFIKTRVETVSGDAYLYDFSRKFVADDAAASEEKLHELPEEEESPVFLKTVPEDTKESFSSENEGFLNIRSEEPSESAFGETSLSDTDILELLEEPDIPAQIPETPKPDLADHNEESLSQEESTGEEREILELLDPGEEITPPAAKAEEASSNKLELNIEKETLLNLSEPAADETTASDEKPLTSTPPADYGHNARLIGISLKEYMGFLLQFVEETRAHRSLMENDPRRFRETVASLKDASQLLHLSGLAEKLREIEEATSHEREGLFDDFFGMIQHIHDDIAKGGESAEMPPIQPGIVKSEPAGIQTASQAVKVKTETKPPKAEKKTRSAKSEKKSKPPKAEKKTKSAKAEKKSRKAPPSLALDSVNVEEILDRTAPIPFDFSAHVAADELGLPEDLVEEFVIDFVKQAKENIPVFIVSQENKDLETLQKTAHLLKGAASNLHIDPLAKTLEELQYNEDFAKVPDLFRQFVGQLKALDKFIHAPGM